jgi:hypothetical protein
MSKYSFLVTTKEPNYFLLNPMLRLQKHDGWLVGEAIEQEDISRLQSQATIRAVQLARRVSVAKGISLDEAFALLQAGTGLDGMESLSDFTEETLGILASGNGAEQGNARLVTAFIRSRGEGMIDGAWKKVDDWTMEDTKFLTRPMIQKALDFIAEEQTTEVKAAEKKAPKKTDSVPSNG